VSREVARADGALESSRADVAVRSPDMPAPLPTAESPGSCISPARTVPGETNAREEHFGDIGRRPKPIAALRVARKLLDDAVSSGGFPVIPPDREARRKALGVYMDRFLVNRRGVTLSAEERRLLEGAIREVRIVESRTTFVEQGRKIDASALLIQGMMSRFIDDRYGMRQLVAVHLPGEFVDLHAYPMQELDYSVGTLTAGKVAIVPHAALREILDPRPELARKLWFSTLLDGAMHRAWLFRLGRLDGVGRIAHFLSETNTRLEAAGLSNGRRFTLELTQADLGEICGLTTVHTNRVIRQLREAGLCMIRSSLVEIHDREGLARRGDFTPGYLYFDELTLADPLAARP
jgi:CRP-like cAMP-binding protein